MGYEKTTWVAGDVVTAEKLNNIENGIEVAYPLNVTGTVVYSTGDGGSAKTDGQLNKTWQEIYDANEINFVKVKINYEDQTYGENWTEGDMVKAAYSEQMPDETTVYIVDMMFTNGARTFTCLSPNDYPEIHDEIM